MRLTLVGKFAILSLTLAGLCAVWYLMPRSFLDRTQSGRHGVSRPGSVAPHEGVFLGYVGAPALAVLDLSSKSPVPAKTLLDCVGPVTLLADTNPIRALDRVASGEWDAAVVDFPSVVTASMKAKPGFHIALLVSWREGADRLVTRGRVGWRTARNTAYLPGSSGEYVVRLKLREAGLSPADVEKVTARLKPVETLAGATEKFDAVAGRVDQIGRTDAGSDISTVTDRVQKRERMPDVLVVSDAYSLAHPDGAMNLARAFLQGQKRLATDDPSRTTFVMRQSAAIGLLADEFFNQVRPASIEDQREFVGIGTEHPTYMDLVESQMQRTRPAGPTPLVLPGVPVDREPLIRVIADTKTQ